MEYDKSTAQENALLIPGLPDEIATLCIARVPRSSHLNMSGVSVSWRNLLHGREFSKLRRELSFAEEWLYVWTEFENAWRCFDLSLGKSCKLPAMPYDDRVAGSSGIASMDGSIFVIGGFSSCNDWGLTSYPNFVPSKIVSSFDARRYCWKRVADLNVARAQCMTGILGNQLYVFGGYIDICTKTAEAEVYDPISDTWRKISIMMTRMTAGPTVVLEDKFHAMMLGTESDHVYSDPVGIAYDPKTDNWEVVKNGLGGLWQSTATVLNDKLYAAGRCCLLIRNIEEDYLAHISEAIHVYDPRRHVWEMVKASCDAEFDMFMTYIELVTFCGKLCVVGHHHRRPIITVVVLDVKESESARNPTCSATFVGKFELQFEHVLRPVPPPFRARVVDKNCQIIAL